MLSNEELTRKIRDAHTAVLLINDRSRQGARRFRQLKQELAQRGILLHTALSLPSVARLRRQVQHAISTGIPLIIVGGGDGTISAVVGDFVDQNAALGLLPLGTGNSFAKALGVPMEIAGALDVLATGAVARVDLGRMDGSYFANAVDMGMSAAVAQETSNRLKRYFGELAYVLVGLRVFWNYRPFQCWLQLDDTQVHYLAHEILVSNGGVYGQTVLGEATSVNSRELVVMTVEATDRWRLARIWIAFLCCRYQQFPEVHFFHARRIRITTAPAQCIDRDGERCGQTPIEISVAPQALRIMLPSSVIQRYRL